jgi:hypothetical protein
MQGPTHFDLARTLAAERLQSSAHPESVPNPPVADDSHRGLREWIGHRLIAIGERLTPRPTPPKPQVSTGHPNPCI